MFRRSKGLKPVDREWHERRQEARETAFSINEFGDDEIVRFDLDTAGITGAENPETFKYDPAIDLLGVTGTDVRNLRGH